MPNPNKLKEYYDSLDDSYLTKYWLGGVEESARPVLTEVLENRGLLEDANRQLSELKTEDERASVWNKPQNGILGALAIWFGLKLLRHILELAFGN